MNEINEKKKVQQRFESMLHDKHPHSLHHLPHPPFLLRCTTLVGGSKSFPGNKSRTWPAGFDAYFSRLFPLLLGLLLCLSRYNPPPPQTHKTIHPLELDPRSRDVLYLNP